MFKELFILLLLAHIIGDFYFQTSEMSKKKNESIRWVLIHSGFYLLSILIILLPIKSWFIIILGIILSLLHMIIDILKYMYITYLKKKSKLTMFKERNIFFADQLIHLLCIMIVAYYFIVNNGELYINPAVDSFFRTCNISKITLISWVTTILIIHKPINIAISKMLAIYKPKDENEDQHNDNNAGRFIGTVERIIIMIFISIGQYAAIGLVLTAKSIARYDKIVKEPQFSEYYLLGTLLSTLSSIIVSLLI